MSLFDTGIRPAVDDWLLKKSQEERDYGSYWSASSAGYCQRKVIFERLGVPKVESDADARKQRVFTAGDLFHQWMQEITKSAGLSIAQELELQDEDLMIRGHIDDLVLIKGEPHPRQPKDAAQSEWVTDSKLILYDYKTQNSRAFSYKRDAMSHFHKMQLGTYLMILRKYWEELMGPHSQVLDLELTEGRILKISKDDLRMSEEQLLWDTQLESDVVSYWKTLNEAWKSKKMPKCTCSEHEGGFMAREQYNGYFYNGEPCSLAWYEKCKKEGKLK